MDDEKLLKAKEVFDTLCRTLDEDGWHYDRDDKELMLECKAQGEDLPIELKISVDPERQLVMLLSHIPCVIPENKILDAAVAVSIVNNRLVDGSFDFDVRSGHMFFRLTNSYIESKIDREVFKYMVYVSSFTVDEYNDKFLMLGKGMLSIEDFLKTE